MDSNAPPQAPPVGKLSQWPKPQGIEAADTMLQCGAATPAACAAPWLRPRAAQSGLFSSVGIIAAANAGGAA